jgi:hypothetical protein
MNSSPHHVLPTNSELNAMLNMAAAKSFMKSFGVNPYNSSSTNSHDNADDYDHLADKPFPKLKMKTRKLI